MNEKEIDKMVHDKEMDIITGVCCPSIMTENYLQAYREGISDTAGKYSWFNASEVLPEDDGLVLVAILDTNRESFQYYVGWYNDVIEKWWLADYGWTFYVSFWKPIEAPEISDLLKEFD